MMPAPTAMTATSQPTVPATPLSPKTSACSRITPRPIAANGSSVARSRRGGGSSVGRLLRQHGPEGGVEQQAETVEAEEDDQSDAHREHAETPRCSRQPGGDPGDDPVVARPVQAARRAGVAVVVIALLLGRVRSDRHTSGARQTTGNSPRIRPADLRVASGSPPEARRGPARPVSMA